MSKTKDDKMTFEAGVARLEGLIEELENGELDLDRSLAVFEEGINLSRQLNQKLDEAEKKLELLLKDENGQPMGREISFDREDENDI